MLYARAVYNPSVVLGLAAGVHSVIPIHFASLNHNNNYSVFVPKNLLRRRKLSFTYKMKYLAILIATLAASVMAQNNKNDK